MTRFKGQVAVVTGGASGIGFAIAQRLASEGAAIRIFDLNAGQAASAVDRLRGDGADAGAIEVDITSEPSVEAAFGQLRDAGDTVSIVVNSAGVVGPTSLKAGEVRVADFETTLRVNVTGSFLMLKHGIQAMQPTDYGRILLIASVAGKDGNAGMSAYSTSKAAVIGLVKAAGKEYAETGITINALAPAVIRTPMVESLAPEQVKYMTDKIPMKRCGTLEEVSSLAAWIVSPEASYNTGFTFDLTGGRAVY